MSQDRDFDAVRSDAEDVFRRALAEPGPITLAAQVKLRDAEEALAKAECIQPKSSAERIIIAGTRASLAEIRELLKGLDVDIESIPERLSAATAQFEVEVVEGDLVDCDAYECHGYPNGYVVEHQRLGKLKLKSCDGELYANGVRIILCRSRKQQARGSIRGCKLLKELRGKPVLNACVCEYLVKHPCLIPDLWSGTHVHFWGTIDNVGGKSYVPGIWRSPVCDNRWIYSGSPLDRPFGPDDVAAVLAS
jgi:hypothetical protein